MEASRVCMHGLVSDLCMYTCIMCHVPHVVGKQDEGVGMRLACACTRMCQTCA
jgi:hypothetical protein